MPKEVAFSESCLSRGVHSSGGVPPVATGAPGLSEESRREDISTVPNIAELKNELDFDMVSGTRVAIKSYLDMTS